MATSWQQADFILFLNERQMFLAEYNQASNHLFGEVLGRLGNHFFSQCSPFARKLANQSLQSTTMML